MLFTLSPAPTTRSTAITLYQSLAASAAIEDILHPRASRTDFLDDLSLRTAGAGPAQQSDGPDGLDGLSEALSASMSAIVAESATIATMTCAATLSGLGVPGAIPFTDRMTAQVAQATREAMDVMEDADDLSMYIIV